MKSVIFAGVLLFAATLNAGAQQAYVPQPVNAGQQPSLSQQIANSTYQNIYTPAPAAKVIVIEKKKLPFFCRQEVKIEEKTKLPLRIRMGSLEQSNFLEQKTDYVNKGF